MRRHFSRREERVCQPGSPVRHEVDPEKQTKQPEGAGHRKSRQYNEAGNDSERSRREHGPACFPPMSNADEHAQESRKQKQQSKHVIDESRAGLRLAHKRNPERDIERTEQYLPHKSSPTSGPEDVEDFESSAD